MFEWKNFGGIKYVNIFDIFKQENNSGSNSEFTGFGDAIIGKDTNKTLQIVSIAAIAFFAYKVFSK